MFIHTENDFDLGRFCLVGAKWLIPNYKGAAKVFIPIGLIMTVMNSMSSRCYKNMFCPGYAIKETIMVNKLNGIIQTGDYNKDFWWKSNYSHNEEKRNGG